MLYIRNSQEKALRNIEEVGYRKLKYAKGQKVLDREQDGWSKENSHMERELSGFTTGAGELAHYILYH